MTAIDDIIKEIETYAPLYLQESYDNSGYTCGNPHHPVKGILLTIDITPEVVREAIDKGCNLIISHHPLIFKGIHNILPGSYIADSLILAIKHDITLYAAHTNMDATANGVSWKMAEKLGLTDCRVLSPKEDGSGLGIIGNTGKEIGPVSFLEKVKTVFGCPIIKHSPICRNSISRVALCGGSGAEFIADALRNHAELYISADIKYHDWFLADKKIIIADIGHFESEQFTKEIFYDIVRKKITNFEVLFSETVTNPVSLI